MADIGVCSDSWNGTASENFNWQNGTSAPIVLSQAGNNTWPFTSGPPISVGSGAKQSCQLIGTPGTYYYDAGPCPSLGNPRKVVISPSRAKR